IKKRMGSIGLHLLSPLIGFAVIAYVLISTDLNARIGGSVWLGIGIVIAVWLRMTGRSTELRLE
ncbi:MAG: amino acid permease, partial [Gemmatimonadaceae bacterium]